LLRVFTPGLLIRRHLQKQIEFFCPHWYYISMFIIDQYYLYLLIPTILFSLIAQVLVKSTFSTYSKKNSRRAITGAEAASVLLRANGITDVTIKPIGGTLTDHYNPGDKTLALSAVVHEKTSISAIGVAAHEAGHAIQHHQGYGPLVLRSTLVPAAQIGSGYGPYLALAGILFSFPLLIDIGIGLFAAAVLFYIITLPVEFNASSRALAQLRAQAILTEDELSGARKVLAAAALTYVASTLSAVLNLLRLILLRRGRR